MANKTANHEVERLRHHYRNYLLEQGMTPDTLVSDAFYLYRHDNTIDFLELLQIEEEQTFQKAAYEHLCKTLQEKSAAKGNNVSAYMRAIILLRKSVNGVLISPKEAVYTARISEAKVQIPRPSCDEVDKYLLRWDENASLSQPEAVLQKLFTQTCPKNICLDEIMLKTAALNTVYSTHIYSVYPVAQRILSLGVDDRLSEGDETLVNELMQVVYEDGKKVAHYSFATKYCSFHNPNAFPIYDSYVDKILRYYRDQEGFSSFKDSELKNYSKFKQILDQFRRYFGLEQYTTKELDRYLWQFGKEYFSLSGNKYRRFG